MGQATGAGEEDLGMEEGHNRLMPHRPDQVMDGSVHLPQSKPHRQAPGRGVAAGSHEANVNETPLPDGKFPGLNSIGDVQ